MFELPDASIVDLTMVTKTLVDLPIIFYPYYFLLGSTGIYHSCYGIVSALKTFDLFSSFTDIKTGNWSRFGIVIGLVMMSTVVALGGWYESIDIPMDYIYDQLFTF
ncbi:hypothetical protein HDV02_006486 [Globomyces sp. JEL0801]|nr:hypothetical protein HDV02_006486 [Globomyces sp. JEL0801]